MDCKCNPSVYRLDELLKTCSFPVAVQIVKETTLNETFDEETLAEDVIVIESKRTQHKIAATFCNDSDTFLTDELCKSSDSIDKEILIPLTYKGKLKVTSEIKSYGNFRELSRDFPRYAKVCQLVAVISADGQPLIIPAGTIVELDRIIPGLKRGFTVLPDQLVIRFDHQGKTVEVTVSTTTQGLFQTEPDNNEYTIKEAVDKYHLPKVVTFLDDGITRVYSQELNGKTKNTLMLNRLVTQDVLVGHYIPIGSDNYKNTDHWLQQTLVVIHLDDHMAMTTKFKVCKDVIKDKIYKSIRNMSDDIQLLEDALYVNFASTSGIDRISLQSLTTNSEINVPTPAPRTTCSSTLPAVSSSAHTNSCNTAGRNINQHRQTLPNSTRQPALSTFSSDDVSTTGTAIPISPGHQDVVELQTDEGKIKKRIKHLIKSPSKLSVKMRNVFRNKNKHNHPEQHASSVDNQWPVPTTPEMFAATETDSAGGFDESAPDIADDNYTQIDESLMILSTKTFESLSQDELIERLRSCAMDDFARVCKLECLDGNFLSKLTRDQLAKSPFNLTNFQIFKFERIKQNWIPI